MERKEVIVTVNTIKYAWGLNKEVKGYLENKSLYIPIMGKEEKLRLSRVSGLELMKAKGVIVALFLVFFTVSLYNTIVILLTKEYIGLIGIPFGVILGLLFYYGLGKKSKYILILILGIIAVASGIIGVFYSGAIVILMVNFFVLGAMIPYLLRDEGVLYKALDYPGLYCKIKEMKAS